jgi:hypothetical protein
MWEAGSSQALRFKVSSGTHIAGIWRCAGGCVRCGGIGTELLSKLKWVLGFCVVCRLSVVEFGCTVGLRINR